MPVAKFEQSGSYDLIGSSINRWDWDSGDDSSNTAALVGRLANRWKRETCFFSSPMQKMSVPTFSQLVQLGQDRANEAIPALLVDLRNEPSHLFLVLQTLTDDNPVPESAYGDLDGIVAAWVAWGIKEGHLKD